jgi:uncharacterized protein YqjF (DUF2071 family)
MFGLVSGGWNKIIFVNYAVDPAVLQAYVPAGTSLAYHNGRCFLTLAAFVFSDIAVAGIRLPVKKAVPEINLRFYVAPEPDDKSKKGVVFIRENIPSRAIALAANLIYQEHYRVKKIHYDWEEKDHIESVAYEWSRHNKVCVRTVREKRNDVKPDTEADFILHNFWGYTGSAESKTRKYKVSHPRWSVRQIVSEEIRVNFGKSFGEPFAFLDRRKPDSVFLTDGSPVSIHRPRLLT